VRLLLCGEQQAQVGTYACGLAWRQGKERWLHSLIST
jgi:hypothetical protein